MHSNRGFWKLLKHSVWCSVSLRAVTQSARCKCSFTINQVQLFGVFSLVPCKSTENKSFNWVHKLQGMSFWSGVIPQASRWATQKTKVSFHTHVQHEFTSAFLLNSKNIFRNTKSHILIYLYNLREVKCQSEIENKQAPCGCRYICSSSSENWESRRRCSKGQHSCDRQKIM